MKTLIVGTGGVGGFYGGLLAKSGNDVTFVARGDHYKEIKESGLHIKSVVGDFTVKPARVISSVSEAVDPDLILLCVKSYDTQIVSKDLASVVKQDTVVLSLQNGIDNDEIIQKHLNAGIVVPGIAYIISERKAPGLIEQTAGPRTIIFGRRDKKYQDELNNVAKIMRNAGIEASNSAEIEKELWIKFLWIITFAGMTSLFRSPIGPIVSNPETMSIYTSCLDEAFSVAKALKINVGKQEYESIIQKSEKYKTIGSNSKSSMLVDIENHRQTEIESLHGKLCKLAKEAGVAVPINEIIYHVVRFTHSSG